MENIFLDFFKFPNFVFHIKNYLNNFSPCTQMGFKKLLNVNNERSRTIRATSYTEQRTQIEFGKRRIKTQARIAYILGNI